MKNFQKINLLLLAIFFLFSCLGINIGTAKATGNYPAGTLLSKIGSSEIYLVGVDNKKYVFPDKKTYLTWYEDFRNVQKVSTAELDLYPNGGVVTYRPGTKLIKHRDSAKVFAIEPGGVAMWIPSQTIAQNLYGDNWSSLVQDIDSGVFVTNYKDGGITTDGVLPTGTLVKISGSNDIWYINNGYKRAFTSASSFSLNNFKEKDIITIDNFDNYHLPNLDPIIGIETALFYYFTTKTFVHPTYNFSFYYPNNYNIEVVSDDYILFRDIFNNKVDSKIQIEKNIPELANLNFYDFTKDRAIANCSADGANSSVYCEYLSLIGTQTAGGDNIIFGVKLNLSEFTTTNQVTTSRMKVVYGIDLNGAYNNRALLLSPLLGANENNFINIILDHFHLESN